MRNTNWFYCQHCEKQVLGKLVGRSENFEINMGVLKYKCDCGKISYSKYELKTSSLTG